VTTPVVEAAPFIGRSRELADVRALLTSARLVTLTGVGGAGKTRIATAIAAHPGHGDGRSETVWAVPLGDVQDPRVVGFEVVQALGLPVASDQAPVDALVDLVADHPVLLVLDSCEQVVDACAGLVRDLLDRCPRLVVLATSRQSLGVSGEQVYDVPPMRVPDPGRRVRLDELDDYEGVRFFLDRAAAAAPGFAPTEIQARGIAELCTELEGLPLALELAAARIPTMTPEAIVAGLRGHVLPGQPAKGVRHDDAPAGPDSRATRHASVEASVGWSYELCTEQEQLLWQRLSVFSGGFGLDAAEHVCSGPGLEATEVLDVLTGLIDKSVVVRDPDVMHYRMLETIRRYGAVRLAESGGVTTTRRRHRQWFEGRAMVLGLEWLGPRQARWVDYWRRNQANLRLVLEATADDPDGAPSALVLVMALEGHWLVTGRFAEARHWLDRALATAAAHGTGNPGDIGAALSMCAYLGGIQGDRAYAGRQIERASAVLHDCQDGLVLGYHAFAAGSMHLFQGDMDQALRDTSRSLDLFRAVGHVNHVPTALLIVAMCHEARGEPEPARAAKVECLAMTEAAGELYARSLLLWRLGQDAQELGHHDEAVGLQVRALCMKWALRDVPGVALVLEALASVEVERGHAARAATLLGAAEATWRFEMADPLAAPFAADLRRDARSSAVSVLGDAAFHEAVDAGRGLGLEQAVAYALETAAPEGAPPVPGGSPLTPREAQVAGLVAAGLTNADIADRLVISVRTVQGHLENILRKLEFTSRAQVAAWVAAREQSLH